MAHPAPAGAFASIAILPFVADDRSYDDVAEGLAEETINRLAGAKVVRVAPRTSAFRFRDPAVDVQAAGRALGVEAVVTGHVTLRDEALVIQVDLVDVARGAQAWGERYRGRASDLPRILGRVAQDVLKASGVVLTPDQTQQLARALTENADAYRAYLKGRYYWNQRTEDGLRKSIDEFERAVDLDRGFAAAYSGLADAFTTLGFLSYLSPAASFPVAERHARRALEIDSSLAEPHASLAYVMLYYHWDWKGAEDEFKRALELNLGYSVAHQWYSVFLLAAGRPEEAFREILLAQERDPLSLAINTDVGFHHYYNRRYDAAVKQLTTVLEMNRDFPLAHLWLGRTYQELKQYPQSLAEYRQAGEKLGDWPVVVAARGYVNAVSGRTSEASQDLAKLEKQSHDRFVTSYGVALVHAGLGDKDSAFVWLDKAFAERSHWLVWLQLDPRWDSLRSDRRFEQLVARMGFPAPR
jgi:TolB-like protein/Tfp pilus assembly protein PilF